MAGRYSGLAVGWALWHRGRP